MLKDIGIVLLD